MYKLLLLIIVVSLNTGCTSYAVIKNSPATDSYTDRAPEYSIKTFDPSLRESNDNSIILAFSGGGTRAAALSYGVLKELRDTPISGDGGLRLLDEVDAISSVSGGSFTAAYYGLHGEGIFDDFEEVFLRKDVEGALIRRVLSPVSWFSLTGRTEMAVNYYEAEVFKGATFADMLKQDGPMIVINASDLGYGVRFSFLQDYFNLLCSDLLSFPVARAVAASSAVPVLFNSVVVKNYSDCSSELPAWLEQARLRAADNRELELVIDGLETYFNRSQRKYAHFVDGGLTDNLGLRAVYEVIELAGGPEQFLARFKREKSRRIVLISVNASTDPEPTMDQTNKQPPLEDTINAMTDIQLHRYNAATLQLMQHTMKRWAQELSTPEQPVEPYFIEIGFTDIADKKRRRIFNQTPTSFQLSDEQVDQLIDVGGELLRDNPEFQRLMSDLDADQG